MRPILLPFVLVSAAAFGAPLDDAVGLYRGKKFGEARVAFESVVAAQPGNAAACYYLGMTLEHGKGPSDAADAVTWLARAVALAPGNEDFLAEFGGASLELARKTRSYSACVQGRDAMLRAIELDPDDLDARDGLMQFYAQAPWPLGDRARAYAQAGEIRRRDPLRGILATLGMKMEEGRNAEAAELCGEALKLSPNNPVALFDKGKLASVGAVSVDSGLAALSRYDGLQQEDRPAARAELARLRARLLEMKAAAQGQR